MAALLLDLSILSNIKLTESHLSGFGGKGRHFEVDTQKSGKRKAVERREWREKNEWRWK